VPELVVNVQLTLVAEDILLPVEMKVNKTLEPAQIFNSLLELLYRGLVEKFAFNCPEAFPKKKSRKKNKLSSCLIMQ